MNSSMYYNTQIIIGENSTNTRAGNQTIHKLRKPTMMPGTFAGIVSIEEEKAYSLIHNGVDGRIIITPIGTPKNKILTCHVNLKKSIITIDWDKSPRQCGINANYEYEVQ
jgi:hypothetical protein